MKAFSPSVGGNYRRGRQAAAQLAVSAVLAILLGMHTPIHAQSYSWNTPDSGNWSDNANWSPQAPTSSSTTALNFGGSSSYTATNDIAGAFAANQLNFNGAAAGATITIDLNSSAGATGITLAGSSPSIALASTNQAAVAFSAAVPITLGAAAAISNNSSNGALLTISGNINNSSSLLTVNGSANTTINGVISGSGGLTMSGTGLLQLGAANTYTGITTVSGGTLQQGTANALGSSTIVSLGTAAGTTFDLNSYSVTVAGLIGGGTSGGNVTLGSGSATLTVNCSTGGTFSGNVTGSGNLIKTGTGAWTLAGTGSSYSGTTTINAGAIIFSGGLSPNTTVIVNNGGTAGLTATPSSTQLKQFSPSSTGVIALSASLSGTFDFSGDPSGANLGGVTLGATGAFTFSGTIIPANGVYALGGGGGTLTVSAALTGSANTLSANANGSAPSMVILTNTGNWYTGVSIGVGTTLQISGADAAAGSTSSLLGAVPAIASTNITFQGGTLQLGATGTTLTSTRSIVLGAAGGAINTNGFALTLSNAFSGSGPFTKLGSGTLTLNSPLGSIAGLSVVSPGSSADTLNLGGQSVTVNGGLTITGVVNGTSAVTEFAASLTNFTGLQVTGPVNLGVDSAATVTAASGAAININAGANTVVIGNKASNGTANCSYATTFTASSATSLAISAANLSIGGGTTFSGTQLGTLTLPSNAGATASINVASGGTLQVGGGNADANSKVTGRIVLGNATTTIAAPYIDLGANETSGVVAFNTGSAYSTPGGVLILSGPAASSTNIDVGRNTTPDSAFGFNSATNTISAFDTNWGAIIGPASASSTSGYAMIGTLRLGFFDAPNSGSGTGLFVVDGAASRVSISSIVLAEVTSSATNPLSTRGVFTVNEGIVLIGAGGIATGTSSAIGSSQVNIFGGTLNMQGNNIGALDGQSSPVGAGLNLTGGTLLNAGNIATSGANFNQSGGTLVRNQVGTTAIAGAYNVTSSAPGVSYTVPGTASAFNYGNPAIGGATLLLDSVSAGGLVAVTAASLNRTGTGTLNIIPQGGSLGANETVSFSTSPATIPTTTATPLVPVFVVAQNNGTTKTAGTYLTQTSSGLVPLTYSPLTDITQGTSADVFDANSNSTNTKLSSALNLLALRSSVVVDLHGNALTIGSGSGQSGVLLNGGTLVDSVGGGTLSFGAAEAVIYAGSGTASTIIPTITGSGGLTFFGSAATATNAAGTLAILANNTSTLTAGVVNINGGILAADTSSGSATGSLAINVNAGGTLAGSGTVAGAVSVGRFGTVAPGVGGNLATGTLSIGGNSVFAREGAVAIRLGASGSNDELLLTGSSTTLTFQYGAVVDLTSLAAFNPAQSAAYFIAATGGGAFKTTSMTGTTSTVANGTTLGAYTQGTGADPTKPIAIVLAPNFTTLATGASFQLVTSGTKLELTYTAVPEPAHLLLICTGLLIVLARCSRCLQVQLLPARKD